MTPTEWRATALSNAWLKRKPKPINKRDAQLNRDVARLMDNLIADRQKES